MKKNNIILSLILLLSVAFVSCDNSGDKIYLSELDPSDMIATSSNVEITMANKDTYLLGFAWTKNTLVVSNAGMGAPNVAKITMEVSATSDFSTTIVQTTETGLGKSYTGTDLNSIAKSLNLTANVASDMYFRLRGSVANNINAVYSNVVDVKVTPFEIDMTKGYILDKKKKAMDIYLYSAQENGIYSGFVNAASWSNYFLQEGDETIWGNDEVSGDAFKLSNSSDCWNMWYPGLDGCYYTTVDTKYKEWYTTHIEAVSLTGDIVGSLNYNSSTLSWSGDVVIAANKEYNFGIKMNGTLFNYSTGANEGVANSLNLSGSNGLLEVKEGTVKETLESGNYTVTLNLQKSDTYSYTFTKK